MRVSQHIVGLLALVSAFVVYHFATAFSAAWREHANNVHGAALAEATAVWIDGQVALSLERSFVQVALAQEPDARAPLIARIEEQREIVDGAFQTAFEQAARSRHSVAFGSAIFLAEGRRLVEELRRLRIDIDLRLRAATTDPQAGRTEGARTDADADAVARLIALIDDAAVTRENLRIQSTGYSSYALALTEMQRRAWEAREFAGRVRTHYAIATLERAAFASDVAAALDAQMARARDAWRTLRVVGRQVDLPPDLADAVRVAERRFAIDHQDRLAEIDRLFVSERSDGALLHQELISFDAFFAESSAALAAIERVAICIGEKIAVHWEERVAASQRQFWLNAVVALGAIAFTVAFSIFLRRTLIAPIADATRVLTRVASGDLEATVARAPRELVEIAALHDALERIRAGLRQAERMEAHAKTDHLTGLPNRRHLEDWLHDAERHRLQTGDAFAYLDLDEFKPINDTFGHEVGDAVLREIATRLRAVCAHSSEIWRLGGDEFAFLIRGAASDDDLAMRADAVLDAVCQPIPHGDRDLFVAASIGVAVHDGTILRAAELLSRADAAMFTAKQRPVGQVEIYTAATTSRRFGLESRRAISNALAAREFFPLYQPQYDMLDGGLVGVEALARWRRADGSAAEPAAFFDMIDYFEMSAAFDLNIAEQVLDTMAALQASHGAIPQFSVNVGAEALASSETRKAFLQLLSRYEDIAPHLTVEVTENALLDRSAVAIRKTLAAFMEAGLKLSMDDFGTGYGSFRHLQEYSFDEIKIDKSFVQKMQSDRGAYVIIEGFLTIARGLDTTVVAEGVETEAQRDQLMRMGCPTGQGYLFGRPLAGERLPELLLRAPQAARAAG